MYECPHCSLEMRNTEIRQTREMIEMGVEDFPLDRGNIDIYDTVNEEVTSVEYYCPECDGPLNYSEIREVGRENTTPRNIGGPVAEGEGDHAVINPQFRRFNQQMGTGETMVECPECNYVYNEETKRKNLYCPRCFKSWKRR